MERNGDARGFRPGGPGPFSWTTERMAGATSVLFLTGRAGRLAELVIQRALRSHRLDGSQLSVLVALTSAGQDGAMSHRDLTRLLAQTPSGTTRTVKRLERAELVAREPDPSDGRSYLLRITPAGTRLLGDAMTDLLGQFEGQLEERDPVDLVALVEPLQRVAEMFEHQPDRTPLDATGLALRHNSGAGDRSGGRPSPGEAVGPRIRQRRTELGLSQGGLAAAVGVGAPHLSKIERGLEQPSEAVLRGVATALGLDPDELLLGAGVVPRWMAEALATDPGRAARTLRQWR